MYPTCAVSEDAVIASFCCFPSGQEGEIGELYIKGPGVFKEYYNRPDATADTMTKDGWFKTGITWKKNFWI